MHVTGPLIRLTELISRNGFDWGNCLTGLVYRGRWILTRGRYLDESAAVSDKEIEADHASFWNHDATCAETGEDTCTTAD